MFDWYLFAILVLVSLPGILISVPGVIHSMVNNLGDRLPAGKPLPPTPVLILLSSLQSVLFVAAAAVLGIALTGKVGLSAPFFAAIGRGEPIWPAVQAQLLPAVLLGAGGALVIVALYYLVYRPRLDRPTVESMERLRMELGLGARLLYGGIVEEVLFRWGVLTLLVWLAAAFLGGTSPTLFWVAIVLSGVLFGLGHMPSYVGAGCRKSPLFLSLMIVLNLWATLICGWLFWHYGLLAAMLAHMLYHLVWYPFDRLVAGRELRSAGAWPAEIN